MDQQFHRELYAQAKPEHTSTQKYECGCQYSVIQNSTEVETTEIYQLMNG